MAARLSPRVVRRSRGRRNGPPLNIVRRVAALTSRERIALLAIVAFTTLAGIARYANAKPLLAFAAATVALAGLAYIVSFATEQVGERFGPAVTGLMQSTLGNLPELFVVIFALRAGHTVVAQTSIIGSIFANALLVLGLVIVVGATRSDDNCMRFGPKLANDTATLLLLCNFIIVLIALSLGSSDPASHHVKGVSTIGAICLLSVYVVWVIPYVRNERRGSGEAGHGPRVPLALSATLLGIAGAGSAFVSDWFIHALEPAIAQLGVSEAFAGLVIVAIAGNAVENATGLVLAYKGQSDLAISVVKNSVAQIAAFLFPVLVLISLLFAHQLTFALAPVYVGALGLTAIAVWQVTGDGEASAFEGWALVATYVMLAALTLYE
jgi:Ca2+:H+ antiporter